MEKWLDDRLADLTLAMLSLPTRCSGRGMSVDLRSKTPKRAARLMLKARKNTRRKAASGPRLQIQDRENVAMVSLGPTSTDNPRAKPTIRAHQPADDRVYEMFFDLHGR